MTAIASSHGAQLHLHDTGGPGDVVLAVHAAGFHGAVLDPLAAALRAPASGPGLRVVAPDLRGHGASTLPEPHVLTWQRFADDVLAVVDGLGLARPVGVGHSLGGAALVLAEARRPGTFRALWLFEPVVFPPGGRAPGAGEGDANPMVAGALRRRRTFTSPADAVANFAAKPPLADLRADALAAYVAHGLVPLGDGTWTLACTPEDEAQLYARAPDVDGWAALAAVRCPVVVANGDDGSGPGTWAPALARQLPHGRHRQLPGLAHFGPMQDPPRVAAAILEDLRGAEVGGGSP